MNLSRADVEAKILQTADELKAVTHKLEYWRQVLSVISNPLFAEISPTSPIVEGEEESHRTHKNPPESQSRFPASQYGALKRLTIDVLSMQTDPVTPQILAKKIQETGYEFRTKTPPISVNDTLKTLEKDGKAKLVGTSTSGAGLWVWNKPEISDWIEELAKNEKEVTEATS